MGINPPKTNLALFTQSSHVPLGFLALNGSRRFSRISQAFFKAAPLRSEDAEAAVALVLGTVLVLVSDMWIFEEGIPRTLLATWKHTAKTVLHASEWLNSFSLNCSSIKTVCCFYKDHRHLKYFLKKCLRKLIKAATFDTPKEVFRGYLMFSVLIYEEELVINISVCDSTKGQERESTFISNIQCDVWNKYVDCK